MPKVTPSAAPRGRTFLREWRLFHKLTQDKVAKQLGIDRSHLSKIERGKEPYNQPFLEALAAVYLCTEPDLLARDPFKEGPLQTVIDELQRADPRTQSTAADVLRALLKKVG